MACIWLSHSLDLLVSTLSILRLQLLHSPRVRESLYRWSSSQLNSVVLVHTFHTRQHSVTKEGFEKLIAHVPSTRTTAAAQTSETSAPDTPFGGGWHRLSA